MSTVKVAINGFGRIGRLAFRQIFNMAGIDVVAINDLTSPSVLAHLLKYDSAQGRFEQDVKSTENAITVNGHEIKIYAQKDPSQIPWGSHDVDVVLECTGFFTDKDKAQAHITAGAKRVVISAPATGDLKTIVYNVNHEILDGTETIISCASCTTNCLAPMAKALNDNYGIVTGIMTTIHAYTNDQNIVDNAHKDLRRARACAMSMIPTSTGAAKAIGLVLPELKGKLDGVAIRVPTPNVSMVDLNFIANKNTSTSEVNSIIRDAIKGNMSRALQYVDEPLVSIDFNHNSFSSCFDATQTKVIGENLVKVCSWYDNEWAFSVRMLDVARLMIK
jgi:glyceraldehyde 3-phosphate dehydrogenase